MSELYISDMTLRESRPRSKRLRGLGFNSRSFSGALQEVVRDTVFDDLFEKVTVGTDDDGNPIFAIHAKYALYSDSNISAGGLGTSTEPEIPQSLFSLNDIAKSSDGQHVGQTAGGLPAVAGQILAFDGTKWYAKNENQGGGGTEVSWGTVSGNTVPLTVGGVSKTLLMDGALSGYLPKSGGQMAGPIHMYGSPISLCTYTTSYDCCLYADSQENVFLKAYRNLYLSTSTGSVYINGTEVGNCLPLSGGTMTGSILPNSTSVNLGSSSKIWGALFANRWYPNANDTTHYIEYTSNGFIVHGNVIATGSVVAGA